MKKHRIAFAGFRHPHILSLWQRAVAHPDCEVVAACESDAAARDQLSAAGEVKLTHEDYGRMLEESDATIVAIGDVYARRGAMVIAALKAGKHVISDKPLCTSLDELDEIEKLSAEKKLSVGCQLDLVELGVIRRLKEVVQSGELGTLCTITIGAQHPLRLGSRAAWYFEPGQHGGTINDIGVHVFDLIPWLSGKRWERLISAREWNAKAVAYPHFKDGAQFHGLLEGGLTCYADVSYLAPDKLGYELPHYWRITVHGTKGVAEISYGKPSVQIITDEDSAARELPTPENTPAGYLQEFFDEIDGAPSQVGLTTARVLSVSRWALKAQHESGR